MAAPCCGARYAEPRYLSTNFSSFAYWTDGWRDESLMPNDEGLRHCQCGRFILAKELLEIETADSSELPRMDGVLDEELPECIQQSDHEALEVAARLAYWRSLNHPYRQRYREHRDAEEAATKAAWDAANPDRRTWWDKLRGREPPVYRTTASSPFTLPAFDPSPEQLQNMLRLSTVLQAGSGPSQHGYDALTLAELYREQGRFDEARSAVMSIDEEEKGVTSKLITQLIEEKQAAPVRYRL